MWPGFDFRTLRHLWVEFVVGSRPCSKKFFTGRPRQVFRRVFCFFFVVVTNVHNNLFIKTGLNSSLEEGIFLSSIVVIVFNKKSRNQNSLLICPYI